MQDLPIGLLVHARSGGFRQGLNSSTIITEGLESIHYLRTRQPHAFIGVGKTRSPWIYRGLESLSS